MRSIPPVIEQKLLSKVQAGSTGVLAGFWVSRPTIPLTENTYLERQIVQTGNISKVAVAVSHPSKGQSAREIFLAYIEEGTAKVKSAAYKVSMASHAWKTESFAASAEDVALCFDGTMPKYTDNTAEFVTEKKPWVFWVSNGELRGKILGLLGEVSLAASGCTRVTAIRATQSDTRDLDFGLVVFFILSGSIYYRQLIANEWTDAVQVSFGPEGVTWQEISAFRTWDYRIGLQAMTSTGALYELVTEYQGIGKHGSEHLEIKQVSIEGSITGIAYHNNRSQPEHLMISRIETPPALYGGLYHSGTPAIISAYNTDDSNDDWGKIAVFVFDKHLTAAEIAAQASCFSIVDSRNVSFVAQTASLGPDGKTVTLTFVDFNSAYGECNAVYTPGTVTSMAGTSLSATSYTWTPVNLVAPSVPAPEVDTIENVGYSDAGIKRVRFYSTDGATLLETEFVNYGNDTSYGTNEVWALAAFTGIAVPDVTEDVTADLDLYLARWRVRYYSQDGTYIRYTEYVVDGEDAVWGAGRDWSYTSGGVPSSNILENISSNIDVYSCADYVALSYIQSSGNDQWINTAITIKANTKIEADIYVDRYVAGSGSYLCAYGSGSGTGYLGFCVTANSRIGNFDYCGGGNGYMNAVGAYEQQIKVIINHATGLAQWFDSNGDLIAGVQHSTVNPSSGGSIGIFALSDWGRRTAMKGRIYGFKIYEGSTLVFDGRPALDAQSVPCLYDMISTNYFYSYTSTPFSAPTE